MANKKYDFLSGCLEITEKALDRYVGVRSERDEGKRNG